MYQHLGNETLASYNFWHLLVKAGKECDQLEKAVKDKEYLHSLNQKALETITGFPLLYDCFDETKELEELFKDQTLVDRMSTYHIGELLENSGDVSDQVCILRIFHLFHIRNNNPLESGVCYMFNSLILFVSQGLWFFPEKRMSDFLENQQSFEYLLQYILKWVLPL